MKWKNRSMGLFGAALAVLALIASLTGLLYAPLYDDAEDAGVFSEDLRPGTYSQDLITVPAALVLLILSGMIYFKRGSSRTRIIYLGLVSYLFYGYGLLSFGGTFTALYPVYIFLFGGSLVTFLMGILSFDNDELGMVPRGVAKTSAVYLIVIAIVFNMIWFAMMVPASLGNERPEAYPVFIMDLCFVMPFFIWTAVSLLKKDQIGTLFLGISLVHIFALILSVVIGEGLAPVYDMELNLPMIGIFSLVLIFSMVLAVKYFTSFNRWSK